MGEVVVEDKTTCFICNRVFNSIDYEENMMNENDKYIICKRCDEYSFEGTDYEYCLRCRDIIIMHSGLCDRCVEIRIEEMREEDINRL